MTLKTVNDKAWEELFEKYKLFPQVDKHGYVEIGTRTIKSVREPRLMAKYDHQKNLPSIFKKNNLTILPISRSKYIIGKFKAYNEVEYNKFSKISYVNFPFIIESIDYKNLYSENVVLHCAHITGMISEILQEEAVLTVSGRMSSGHFDFLINTYDNKFKQIAVTNSQLEIDAAFETENYFSIIEAKIGAVDDFIIRQLYFPYRLWNGKLKKKVIPILLTFSNDIFSFFTYNFEEPIKYNSISLISQNNFIIGYESITLDDIYGIYNRIKIVSEETIPFPQADNFSRVIDLLGLLLETDLSKEYITQNYDFDVRQTDYYTNAGIYLHLIYKRHNYETEEIIYSLTESGRRIMSFSYKNKYLSLVKLILQHKVFYRVLSLYFEKREPPKKEDIVKIMKNSFLYNMNAESTYNRRSQTISAWISWILSLVE